MIFIRFILLLSSIYIIYRSTHMIFDIIISHSSYNKAFKRYNDINNKIANFLYQSDNINKYRSQTSEYLKITYDNLKEFTEIVSMKDYTMYYIKSYKELYDLFKDIIPELVQEEREKKLNKILLV